MLVVKLPIILLSEPRVKIPYRYFISHVTRAKTKHIR